MRIEGDIIRYCLFWFYKKSAACFKIQGWNFSKKSVLFFDTTRSFLDNDIPLKFYAISAKIPDIINYSISNLKTEF